LRSTHSRYLMLKGATRVEQFYANLVANWFPVELLRQDWDTAADLWAQRHRQGKPIQDADLLIAVAALKTGACLVTNNTRHFDGLGVIVDNWMLSNPT
jgi:predicted nucleic acid-binding protein